MPVDADLVKRISDAVDARRDETVALLQSLVRVPSVTNSEGEVQKVVMNACGVRDLAVDAWEATPDEISGYHDHVGEQTVYEGRTNVAAVRRGTGGGRSILLNAHVDTVENGDPATWTHDPLGAEIVGDLLYGRGSCDMKGGLTSYLAAFDALDALGIRLAGDATVLATVGEEDGGVGALSTILRGYKADAVLITEPTRLALVTAQGGSLVFRMTIVGKSAHAAVRDEGVSAFEKFVPIFQDLLAFEAERNASIDHPLYAPIANKIPINIGIVRTGVWASTVPELLVAEGRVGLVAGEDADEFKAQVVDRIMKVANADPWLREHPPMIEWFGGQFAPAETSPDSPIAQSISAAHAAVTGTPPPVEGVTYGADMRLFTLIGDMPCVMYGAGDVTVAHHADEHISITELLTATKTIACMLVDWCGVAGE